MTVAAVEEVFEEEIGFERKTMFKHLSFVLAVLCDIVMNAANLCSHMGSPLLT